MNRNVELPPRASGEEEIEQLRELRTPNSEVSGSQSTHGSYFGSAALTSRRTRKHSFGVRENGSMSMSASGSMPWTVSNSSSFGSNSNSHSRDRFSWFGDQSSHSSIGGGDHGDGAQPNSFDSYSRASGYASPSVESHYTGTMTPAAGRVQVKARMPTGNWIWPTDPKQRGMEIEYVKMWQKC